MQWSNSTGWIKGRVGDLVQKHVAWFNICIHIVWGSRRTIKCSSRHIPRSEGYNRTNMLWSYAFHRRCGIKYWTKQHANKNTDTFRPLNLVIAIGMWRDLPACHLPLCPLFTQTWYVIRTLCYAIADRAWMEGLLVQYYALCSVMFSRW